MSTDTSKYEYLVKLMSYKYKAETAVVVWAESAESAEKIALEQENSVLEWQLADIHKL